MGLKVPCPTCHGKKKMNDPKFIGKLISYCGPNGERCPQVTCITCNGAGHVIDNSSPHSVDEDAVRKLEEKPWKEKLHNILKGLGAEMTLEGLERQLQEAIDAQDYERCSEIRDEIKRRKDR